MTEDHAEATGKGWMPTVAVLGAGINGAALARELLLSGVSVVVVDADDIACGATAWSTRLIHGGLRYLEYGEVGLVRESLVERDRLARLAPHLVRPLEFYVPVRSRWGGLWAAAARLVGWESLSRSLRGPRGRGSWTLAIGLTLYDLLAVGSRWPRHRMVRAGRPGMPQVDVEAYPFAGIYADGQALYPERLAVELLVDAQRIAAQTDGRTGARFALYTRHHARLQPNGTLQIEAVGHASATPITLRPAAIVNATGAWVDRTCRDFVAAPAPPLIGGTKGSHLVLQAPALREALGDHGVYAEADDGRPVFVLPFGARLVLVGTTDIPYAGDPALARADRDEIDYLLAATTRLFPQTSLAASNVQQHYSGVRPLPAVDPRAGGSPGAITRRHMLVRHRGQPLPSWSIVGGKLTTCRSLAESAAAEVLAALGMPVRSTSRDRPLPGAWDDSTATAADPPPSLVAETAAAAEAAGVPREQSHAAATRMVALFGRRAPEAVREPLPSASGLPPLIDAVCLPTAAAAFAVRHEWARSLDDLVERRLMLVFDEALTRQSLDDLAAVLVACGAIAATDRERSVAACADRLRDHYGKILAAGPKEFS